MLDRFPPKIYVSAIPDTVTQSIPADAVELTSGVDGFLVNDSIDGLSRPEGFCTSSALAGVDASRICGRQTPDRYISFRVIPLPDFNDNRRRLYEILPYGRALRFYVEHEGRTVYIDGEVERLTGNLIASKPFAFTVSILCPFPWFQSVELHSLALSAGEFTVHNAGDIPAGFVWDTWNGTVSGSAAPAYTTYAGLSISISDEKFAYNGTAVTPHVVTIPGQRTFTAGSGGLATMGTAFGMLTADSGWPRLQPGDNTLTVDCTTSDDGTHNAFMWRDTYSGV